MTTIEHNIPASILYDDILTLYTMSGTGSTPTHIVDYGGMFGEQYLWATEDIPNDPKYVSTSAFNYVLNISFQTPHAHTARHPRRDLREHKPAVQLYASNTFMLVTSRLIFFFVLAMALWNVSASVANMVHRGLRAHIGAHGEPPLGLMYHQEMFYAKAGGLSNYEVRVPYTTLVC
jgi:hypothetical protein